MCISRLLTDGVVEAPGGAHFTACVPDYAGTRRSSGPTWPRPASPRRGPRSPRRYLEVDEAELPDGHQQARPTAARRQPSSASEHLSPTMPASTGVTRAEYCAIACAEVFRGDGEVMASAFGTAPALGARLARLTFAPDLVLTDGDAALVVGAPAARRGAVTLVVESHMPYRRCSTWCGPAGAT